MMGSEEASLSASPIDQSSQPPSTSTPSQGDRPNNKLLLMRFESERLSTFASWPANAPVEAAKIAKAGFYRLNGPQVKCSWCGCVLADWQFGDQVIQRHREAKPQCPFILDQSDNVPLLQQQQSQQQQQQQQLQPNEAESQTVDEMDTNGSNSSPVSADANPTPDAMAAEGLDEVSSNGAPPDFRRESTRLRTFSKWNVPFIQPTQLAKSGFVYTGRRDCVRCIFCGEYVGEWDPQDDPIREHGELFPHCPFVQGQDVGNVTLEQEEEQQQQQEHQRATAGAGSESEHEEDHMSLEHHARNTSSEDETGIRPRRIPAADPRAAKKRNFRDKNSVPEGLELRFRQGSSDGEASGIHRHTGPAVTKYSTLEARMRTFRDWPPALKQRPKDLADAGFYYIGYSDQVRCFYCDGGLRNWQPDDDPWTEHSRWFSKCGFIRLVKGDDFIKKCLREHPTGMADINEEQQPQEAQPTGARRRNLSEQEVSRLMSSPLAEQALALGIDAARIKMAFIRRHRETGSAGGFKHLNSLIDAAFAEQIGQEDRHEVETNDTNRSPFNQQQQNDDVGGRDVVGQSTSSGSTTTLSAAAETMTIEEEDEDEVTTTAESQAETEDELPQMRHSASEPLKPTTTERAEPSALEGKKSLSVYDPPQDLNLLENEVRRLKEERTCKICMDRQIGVVFLPCGHLICCVHCAPSLADCPLCRQPIKGTVKTYLS